jgi:cytoskeletal protein CcmA (bactofilin family)
MKATVITVAGDVQGNVLDATRVELLASAALVGDVRAATLTVAPGSRLRGRVECGWGEGSAPAVAPASTPAATSKPAAMPARSEVKAEEPVAALDAAS